MSPSPDDSTRDGYATTGRGRAATARICAALSLALFCTFAAVRVYIELGDAGCWGGGYLMIASALLLCVPGLVLLVVAACLRPLEILWLGAALVLLAFATGVALQLLPGPDCSGSG